MKVYLTYAPEDGPFARRLAEDLENYDVHSTLAINDTSSQFEALGDTDAVIVALSERAAKDARVLATLDAAFTSNKRLIALRVGTVDELPKTLKGVLPLDFSDATLYEETFLTLLDDLMPPSPPVPTIPLLPSDITEALKSDDFAERVHGIELLGQVRYDLDEDGIALAKQRLVDMIFKDPDPSVKSLARTTLQFFETQEAYRTQELEPVIESTNQALQSAQVVADHPTVPKKPATKPLASGPLRMPTKIRPLWYTQEWWMLPIVGVVLALMQAVIAHRILIAFPIALVWIILPWLNVIIRDGGKMDWKMPAPLIGNAILGGVVSSIGAGLALILGDFEAIDILATLAIGVIYGSLIGWLSASYIGKELR